MGGAENEGARGFRRAYRSDRKGQPLEAAALFGEIRVRNLLLRDGFPVVFHPIRRVILIMQKRRQPVSV